MTTEIILQKKKQIQVCCCPDDLSQLNNFIKKDLPRIEEYIRHSCFGDLLDIHQGPLSVHVMILIIQKWNRTLEKFVLDDASKIEFTAEDVRMVYGLPNGENNLKGIERKRIATTFGRLLCEKYDIHPVKERPSSVYGDKILIALQENDQLRQSEEDFFLLYALYALYRVLIPTASNTISLKYVEFLRSPQLGSGYGWSSYVSEKLVDALNHSKERFENPDKWAYLRPAGDLHFLMYILYVKLGKIPYPVDGSICKLSIDYRSEDNLTLLEVNNDDFVSSSSFEDEENEGSSFEREKHSKNKEEDNFIVLYRHEPEVHINKKQKVNHPRTERRPLSDTQVDDVEVQDESTFLKMIFEGRQFVEQAQLLLDIGMKKIKNGEMGLQNLKLKLSSVKEISHPKEDKIEVKDGKSDVNEEGKSDKSISAQESDKLKLSWSLGLEKQVVDITDDADSNTSGKDQTFKCISTVVEIAKKVTTFETEIGNETEVAEEDEKNEISEKNDGEENILRLKVMPKGKRMLSINVGGPKNFSEAQRIAPKARLTAQA